MLKRHYNSGQILWSEWFRHRSLVDLFRCSPTVLFKGPWGHGCKRKQSFRRTGPHWQQRLATHVRPFPRAFPGARGERLFEGVFGLRAEKRACAVWQRRAAEFVTLLSSRRDISNFTLATLVVHSRSAKSRQPTIIKPRRASNLPVLQAAPSLLTYFTEPRKTTQTASRGHVSRRGCERRKKTAVNLLLRHEVKRCNLLLSFVSYRGSCSPGFSWGSLTFPAMFLWLGAHLTPIKPSTCKSTDCSGARWKVCFFSFPSPAPSSKPKLQPSGTYRPCESQWRFGF